MSADDNLTRALAAEAEVITLKAMLQFAEDRLIEAKAVCDAQTMNAQISANDLERERTERRQLIASLNALEQRLLDAIRDEPDAPAPIDFGPIMKAVEALGTKIGAVRTVPELRREVVGFTPVRGGPDGLIQKIVVNYKAAH